MADDFAVDATVSDVVALLKYYGFELDIEGAEVVVSGWQQLYPASWLRTAVIEALYRGRYKQVSVEEILRSWKRWDKIRQNFDAEFEQLICSKIESELLAVAEESSNKPDEVEEETSKANGHEDESESSEPVAVAAPGTYQKLKAIAAAIIYAKDDYLGRERTLAEVLDLVMADIVLFNESAVALEALYYKKVIYKCSFFSSFRNNII